MEFKIKIEQTYVKIPIQAEQPEETLEIFSGEEKLFEFRVPVCKEEKKIKYDYFSSLDVRQYKGKELTLRGNFGAAFFENICQDEENSQEKLVRPLIHFTAERGWINDPNGLVYQDGQYHLYFQHNPMNTQWQNMSWGHSACDDLLHFEGTETVMYPDEFGPVFSGCGLVNERGLLGLPKDALLFYYSAAGDGNEWSRGRAFTQKIAYSLDGGKTLVKMPGDAIGVIRQDSRDPKVFWHEESGAYIMVLWISGNEFGFFRSENLQDWEQTDSVDLQKAWECPDLFCLDCEGERVWVFTSADGFYYIGTFDGWRFQTDGVRRDAYLTKLPYAAQTYSNTKGRVISLPWLRTQNAGKLYTGMMGIPRELKLVKRNSEVTLSSLPVREYEETKRQIADFDWDGSSFAVSVQEPAVVEVELHPMHTEKITVNIFGQELTLCDNVLFYKGERTVFADTVEEIHMIADRDILEVYVNQGTGNAYYETGSDELQGSVIVKGCKGKGRIFIWRP